METADFEHFRDLLVERRQNLTDWLNSGASLRNDDAQLVHHLLTDIKDALGRIENESFGACDVCHDDIEADRLEIQPIRRVCLDCISAEEKAALEEDLYLASKIHRALLPQTIPEIDGFELEAKSLPAGNIGGDYYDFLPGADGQGMRVVIADAMGHGLPAGLLMSNLQGALRILSSDIESPGPLVSRLNEWICRNVPVTKFVSMICLCLDTTGDSEALIRFTNAGHSPPIVVRADGGAELLSETSGVLGVHENFQYLEQQLTLSSGDYLLLYTDGITEARNEHDEEFGESRLTEFMRAQRGKPFAGVVDNLLTSVLKFAGRSQPDDDLTAIVLRKK